MKLIHETEAVEVMVDGVTEMCTYKVYRDYKAGRGKPVKGFTVVQSGEESGEVPMLTYPSVQTGEHSSKVFANTMAERKGAHKPVRRRVHR